MAEIRTARHPAIHCYEFEQSSCEVNCIFLFRLCLTVFINGLELLVSLRNQLSKNVSRNLAISGLPDSCRVGSLYSFEVNNHLFIFFTNHQGYIQRPLPALQSNGTHICHKGKSFVSDVMVCTCSVENSPPVDRLNAQSRPIHSFPFRLLEYYKEAPW